MSLFLVTIGLPLHRDYYTTRYWNTENALTAFSCDSGDVIDCLSCVIFFQTYSQRLLSPQLRMVFDDDMRASAQILARHSLMDGSLKESGQGRQGGVGLGGMGSLRQSLVSLVQS